MCSPCTPRQLTLTLTLEHLVYLMSSYPILKSILDNSHRQSIINLASTCRQLHIILSTTIDPITKPFPACKADLQCTLCRMPLCEDCGLKTMELQKPAQMLLFNQCRSQYGLVYGRSYASRKEMSMFLRNDSHNRVYVFATHVIDYNQFCCVCYPKHQPKIRKVISRTRSELLGPTVMGIEWEGNSAWHAKVMRRQAAMCLGWGDLPQGYKTRPCTCQGFNTGCDISPHYVRVEDLPVDGELVAFVSGARGMPFPTREADLRDRPVPTRLESSNCPVYVLPHIDVPDKAVPQTDPPPCWSQLVPQMPTLHPPG